MDKYNDPKTIHAWAMIDWANSAFMLIISTAIFPVYFMNLVPTKVLILGIAISNSALYAFCISLAYFIVALIAPVLGLLADKTGNNLKLLSFSTTLGGLACVALYFFDDQWSAWIGCMGFVLGTIGFSLSLVFYDAILPTVASEDQYERVSARGYIYGYFGSVLLLIFILIVVFYATNIGISTEKGLPYRMGFVIVGVWWIGFTRYALKRLPDQTTGESFLLSKNLTASYKAIYGLLKNLIDKKNIKYFLLAYFFYTAGVNTTVYLASTFATLELNFETTDIIILIILIQFTAIVGAKICSLIALKYGNKFGLSIQIMVWIIICITAFFVESKTVFFGLGIGVGMVLGGIQSLSRASYTKLLRLNEITEYNSYFSIYDLLLYISIIFGTYIFGMIDLLFHNLRYSILSIAVLFIISLIGLIKVNFVEKKCL